MNKFFDLSDNKYILLVNFVDQVQQHFIDCPCDLLILIALGIWILLNLYERCEVIICILEVNISPATWKVIDVCLMMKLYSVLTTSLIPLPSIGCFMFRKQLLVHLY